MKGRSERSTPRAIAIVAFGLLGFISNSATAAIIYDEANDGDFSYPTPTAVLTLDVGTNDVLGTGSFESLTVSDGDGFIIEVPTGASLASVTYQHGPVSPAFDGTGFNGFRWDLYGGNTASGTPIGQFSTVGWASLDTNPVFSSALPIGPGQYAVWLSAFVFEGAIEPGSADYRWTFTVEADPSSPVPEPSTLTLFGVGALGMAGAAYRRGRAFRPS